MLFSEMEDESESAIDSMSYNEIMVIVMQLPPGYKMVFNLFVIDGYSHEEIAGMLGISEGTSKSNLFKARKWLQNALQKKMTYNKLIN